MRSLAIRISERWTVSRAAVLAGRERFAVVPFIFGVWRHHA